MFPKPITSDKVESTLRAMLENAGLSFDALHLEPAWNIFIEFCNIPIESRTDGTIVQWGPLYDWHGDHSSEGDKIAFYYAVLRQFDGSGEDFEQLTLEWHYRLDDILDQVEMDSSDWCFIDLGFDVAMFLQMYQETKLFQWLKQKIPYETRLFQEIMD